MTLILRGLGFIMIVLSAFLIDGLCKKLGYNVWVSFVWQMMILNLCVGGFILMKKRGNNG